MEAPVPPVGTTVACARLDYSDSYVPDCWTPSAGARVPPVGTTVHCARLDCSDFCVPDCVPELLKSARDMEESFPVAGDVSGRVCGDGCCAGVFACCCWGGVLGSFCWGVAADASPPADRVTVGVTELTDTGSKLPAELLESVRVTEDCLSGDVNVALPEVSPAVFAGAAAVPVSLTATTGVVSSAVLAGGMGVGSLLMRLLRSM